MKQLRIAVSVLLVIMAAMNIALNYMSGNNNAAWANFSALCAWLIVAGDEIARFFNERKSIG
jgi:heme/copper-type cytochrome/quinol oxidase subunit 1